MSEHDAYREKLQSQLKAWDTRLEQLSERIERLPGDARGEARKQLQAFRAQRYEALTRLQSWDEVRHGVDKAWYELARSFDSLSSRYT
jgi:chromosome segregation ATPase